MGHFRVKEGTEPLTPPTDYQDLYPDAADGIWKIKDDTGTVIPLSGGTPAAHAATHVAADSIQDATAGQKGLATAAQIGALDGLLTGAQEVDAVNFDLTAAISVAEGELAWNDTEKTLDLGMTGGTSMQLGQETDLPSRPRNKQGSQINNGSPVYISGATGGIAEVRLANASEITSRKTIAIATEDVADEAQGRYCTHGAVRDIDTSFGSEGDTVYLDTSDGGLTVTPPTFPNYIIRLGVIVNAHATEGVISVDVDNSRGQDLSSFWAGTFREAFDALATSNGSTITLSIEQSGGGDLTMQFSDGEYILDCTPAQTVALTPGTDSIPQKNYVYIPKSTKVVTVATTDFPTAEHIKVGFFYVSSAAYVLADGALINQNWNDPLYHGSGHLVHITERIRRESAAWFSGCAGQGSDDYTTSGAGTVTVQVGAGVVYQMHAQSFAALDTSSGDNVHVINHDLTPYYVTGNLYDIVDDASGGTLTNTYFNIVLAGVMNKGGEYSPLLVNLPTGTYNNLTDAKKDVSGYDVFSLPREFSRESSTGFLLARLTFRKTGGTWVYQSTVDLRGQSPSSASGGGAGSTATEYSDSLFRVFDNLDITKKVAIDAGGITTGNTRTITMPDKDVTLDDQGDPRVPSSHAASHVAADSIQDATVSQKGLMTTAQATKLAGLAVVYPEFQFFADQLDFPLTSDWAINDHAGMAADSNNSALSVRLFDDTVEEGVGFLLKIPSGATNIKFTFLSRAETTPVATAGVALLLYSRDVPDNAVVPSWSSGYQLTDLSIPTNEYWQEDSQELTLSALSLTAGRTTQFELVRDTIDAGDDLSGDWALLLVKAEFS